MSERVLHTLTHVYQCGKMRIRAFKSTTRFRRTFTWLSLSLLVTYGECGSFCKFSNVMCQSYDKSKLVFKACHLKAVRGEDSYMKVHAHIKEVGREANVSVRLLKRANGWKPFLYKSLSTLVNS
ncbi:unnamed protein product [Ceratitis capitata]|uniref:(Mediterranean fruit fly) hypothetical protein n=1 Tax=Ceratitis capitata TaxID=7213 RepID=A0A811VC37_CERCA|nr:unnamed protein product [Ceratitis capitata]